ncbi:YbaB/EbfC family nucleoid-associated protein [Actinokineospora bangkokensis]|uniref:YbaB/EbfC DNA-binding family protein n=1 Tax=Actinokineospora bangkokensis TaxID=1193682 RepID=A0A1Q9LK02_9PSEU|nr:YbaB/EbfC family nucleoid-associated protein [Actinokineospora bangkokensis]OLR92376.1 hypothetical protein BJP25_20010 [Actinokineospora bangkokensis]
MSDPLANVQRLVDEWERDAVEKAARYEAMRQEVERISLTGSAAEGAVRVTVGSNGIPSGVEMTDRVSRMQPQEIAAAVLAAMRDAQSRYPAELARVVGETVGDTEAGRHIVATAERNFPPPEDPGGELGGAGPRPRRDGPDDDGDFSDRSFMR